MTRVPLYNRRHRVVGYALIDAADYAAVSELAWSRASNGYAVACVDRERILMHRLVCGLTRGDPLEVDHINRNKLDNRRSNLRVCTRAQNGQNLGSFPGTSRFRGVCRKANGRWQAQAWTNGGNRHIGVFDTEEAAAEAAAAFRAEHMPYSKEARAA